jgi:hypothetical protein
MGGGAPREMLAKVGHELLKSLRGSPDGKKNMVDAFSNGFLVYEKAKLDLQKSMRRRMPLSAFRFGGVELLISSRSTP